MRKKTKKLMPRLIVFARKKKHMPKFIPIARPPRQREVVYHPEKELKTMEMSCGGIMGIILMIGIAMSFVIFTWKQ